MKERAFGLKSGRGTYEKGRQMRVAGDRDSGVVVGGGLRVTRQMEGFEGVGWGKEGMTKRGGRGVDGGDGMQRRIVGSSRLAR